MVTEEIINQTTQYAIGSIQGEITSKAWGVFIKATFSALAGVGASRKDLKQLRIFLGLIASLLGVLAFIDLFQLLKLILEQALP